VIHEAINKAAGLVEALSYIQRFHNKVIVVKVGGSIMDDEVALSNILTDIVFMNYVGMQPVLVHGGGKAINAAMEQAGLQPQMVQGRRYTDERTLAIAEHVLCNQINRFIVNFIQSQGTGQGAFFDAETMTPLIDNDGFRKALQIYIDTTKYGPADEINLDVGDTRGLFTSGRCALTLDWGDIGTLAIDPKTSKVADKVGAVIIPGSRQVICC